MLQYSSLIPTLRQRLITQDVTHVNIERYIPLDDDSFGTKDNRGQPKLVRLRNFKHKKFGEYQEGDHVAGLCSLVRQKQMGNGHLPQLETDWKLDHKGEFDLYVPGIAELFPSKQDVYVVATDRGYHFYGTQILSQKEWVSFLDLAYRSPIIDKEHVRSSLERGFSTLRINSNPKKPHNPTLIGKFVQD